MDYNNPYGDAYDSQVSQQMGFQPQTNYAPPVYGAPQMPLGMLPQPAQQYAFNPMQAQQMNPAQQISGFAPAQQANAFSGNALMQTPMSQMNAPLFQIQQQMNASRMPSRPINPTVNRPIQPMQVAPNANQQLPFQNYYGR